MGLGGTNVFDNRTKRPIAGGLSSRPRTGGFPWARWDSNLLYTGEFAPAVALPRLKAVFQEVAGA